MIHLREHASLGGVEEHEVEHEGDVLQDGGAGERDLVARDVALDGLTEAEVDANIVVHQSNQRQREAGVLVEPEQERNVERRGRDGSLQSGQLSSVADGDVVSVLLLGYLSQFVEDRVPQTIMAIDYRSADVDGNLVDDDVPDVPGPGDGLTGVGREGWKGDFQVALVDEITGALDQGGRLATKVDVPGERRLETFHGEVCVTSIYDTPESNLRRAADVHILTAIGDELEKTT